MAKHSQYVSRFPAIVKEMTYLEQKVRIIAFLNMIFHCGKDDRCISFAKVSETCLVEVSDVEFLLMKAMSLELVKGNIDEVSETVEVTWIMPRYLNKEHLQVVSSRISEWERKMEGVITMLENKSNELL